MCVLVIQLCLTLCDHMDCNPPGFSVHGVLQARTLEWVAISFARDLSNQGSNPGLPHCRQILYHLIHQGNPIFKLDGAKPLSHLLQEYLFSLPEISFVTTTTTSGMHYSLFNFIVRPFTVSIFTILLPYKVTKTQMVLPS